MPGSASLTRLAPTNLAGTGEIPGWCYVVCMEASLMESTDSMEEYQSMVINGHKLEIIATKNCDGEWSLCIENVYGIRSVWFDCFESAEIALEVGRKTVETEGVEEFISKQAKIFTSMQ
jgi:hypothetical protein